MNRRILPKMNIQLFAGEESSITKVFDNKTVLNYLRERQPVAFGGEELFPSRKIQGLEIEYIKGANSNPVSASIHGFDTETEVGSRGTMDKVSMEIALIKRKIRMGEKLIIKLNSPRNDQEAQYARNEVFNDVDNMVDSVRTRIEAMRMEILTTGQLVINENGYSGTLDYGVPAEHKQALTSGSLWIEETATPLDDIYAAVDRIVADTGTTPTRALTSRAIVNALLKHTTIRKALFGVNSDRIATLEQLNQLLSTMDLPRIATYDRRYRVQNANGTYTTKRFFDDDKFVIMPDGALGETIYGLTAEEIELQNKPGVDISMIGNIIAEIYKTNDPVAHWTKAVATALPSFPVANEVFQIKVK